MIKVKQIREIMHINLAQTLNHTMTLPSHLLFHCSIQYLNLGTCTLGQDQKSAVNVRFLFIHIATRFLRFWFNNLFSPNSIPISNPYTRDVYMRNIFRKDYNNKAPQTSIICRYRVICNRIGNTVRYSVKNHAHK